MNRDDIIRMAREAGIVYDEKAAAFYERFAALVADAKETELMDSMTIAYMDGYQKGKDAGAAAIKDAPEYLMGYADGVAVEREACAKVLDEMAAQDKWTNYYGVAANAIRARGNSEN